VSDRARTERLNMRLTPAKLATWREEAELAALSLTAFVEASVDDVIAVARINRRHDEQAAQEADRLHSLPPDVARELLNRNVPPEAWPEPGERGRA
jgi:uncharacterized protein (DUF1778 family)